MVRIAARGGGGGVAAAVVSKGGRSFDASYIQGLCFAVRMAKKSKSLAVILLMIGMATMTSMSIYQMIRFNSMQQVGVAVVDDGRSHHNSRLMMTMKRANGAIQQQQMLLDDNNNKLPYWMEEYFTWHTQTRNKLNETNWSNYKYLVLRCLSTDIKCGGASDRLQSIPLMIYKAYQTQRILFIKWERPFQLEEFLVPPSPPPIIINNECNTTTTASTAATLDWRIPTYLDNKLPFKPQPTILTLLEMVNVKSTDNRMLLDTYLFRQQGKGIKWYKHLVQQYENNIRKNDGSSQQPNYKEPNIDTIYNLIWDRIFQPTKPIQTLIDQSMKNMHLIRNNYVAVHVRALYLADTDGSDFDSTSPKVINEYQNAINCGLQLLGTTTQNKNNDNTDKETKIFFASDSNGVTNGALEYGNTNSVKSHDTTVKVVAKIDKEQQQKPLHLDRGTSFLEAGKDTNTHQYTPQDYYSTFVDLYLLKNAKCIAHGRGGYGRWAKLLQQQNGHSCSIDYLQTTCPAATT